MIKRDLTKCRFRGKVRDFSFFLYSFRRRRKILWGNQRKNLLIKIILVCKHSKVDLALAKAQRKVKLQLMLKQHNKEWIKSGLAPYFLTRYSQSLEIDTNYLLDKGLRSQENYTFDPINKGVKNYPFDDVFISESLVIAPLPAC